MIKKIKARWDKATPGPWWQDFETADEDGVLPEPWPTGTVVGEHGDVAHANRTQDAEAIAHAPTDIAYLLHLLDEARESLEWTLSFSEIYRTTEPKECYHCLAVGGHTNDCPIAEAKAVLEKIAEGSATVKQSLTVGSEK